MINRETIDELILRRKAAEETKKEADEIRKMYKIAFDAEKKAKADLVAAEIVARVEALEEFKVKKEKSLSYGFGIRSKNKLSYDLGKALDFAIKHPEFGLAILDVKAFETAVSGLKLDFVTVETVATVTIPKEIKTDE